MLSIVIGILIFLLSFPFDVAAAGIRRKARDKNKEARFYSRKTGIPVEDTAKQDTPLAKVQVSKDKKPGKLNGLEVKKKGSLWGRLQNTGKKVKDFAKGRRNRKLEKKQKSAEKASSTLYKIGVVAKRVAKYIRKSAGFMVVSGLLTSIVFILPIVVAVVGGFAAWFVVMDIMGNGDGEFSSGGVTTVVSEDYGNGNNTTIIGDNSSWVAACQSMWDWYYANIDTYQNVKEGKGSGTRKWYNCDLLDGKTVGDDCSAFVSACLGYAGLWSGGWTSGSGWGSTTFANSGNSTLNENFNHFTPADYDNGTYVPRVGDILAYSGHVEIIAVVSDSGCKSWSWGSVPKNSPCNRASDIKTYIYHMWASNSHTVTDIWQLK